MTELEVNKKKMAKLNNIDGKLCVHLLLLLLLLLLSPFSISASHTVEHIYFCQREINQIICSSEVGRRPTTTHPHTFQTLPTTTATTTSTTAAVVPLLVTLRNSDTFHISSQNRQNH